MSLGTANNGFYSLYITTISPSVSSTGNITSTGNFIPGVNSTSTSTDKTLGDSSHKWRYLYAFSGTIQTSDRSAKNFIHYIENSNKLKAKITNDVNGNSLITTDDVLNFINRINPVTFCYKDGHEEATEDNSDPEMIQLGLIADDIADDKLFKYVGVETVAEEVIEPEEKDEEGNVLKEAIIETKTVRGLQAIPLVTAALTACKYLLNINKQLESRIENLELKLS